MLEAGYKNVYHLLSFRLVCRAIEVGEEHDERKIEAADGDDGESLGAARAEQVEVQVQHCTRRTHCKLCDL